MALNFPNESRFYDAKRNHVQFWGYDNVLEILFLIELKALRKLSPHTSEEEAGYLETFDAALARIHQAALKVYSRGKRSTYTLTATDF